MQSIVKKTHLYFQYEDHKFSSILKSIFSAHFLNCLNVYETSKSEVNAICVHTTKYLMKETNVKISCN